MEYFEVFGDNGACLGQVPRPEVHRRGLWHRSVHCFVWNGRGEMLLQRRAADKDLYPDCWDYAVGEHLQAGESWQRGMQRGLVEELGLEAVAPRPIGGLYREALHWPGGIDAEIQQAFALRHDGVVQGDGVEVAGLAWVARQRLIAWAQGAPEDFTPWFRRELVRLSIAERWDQWLNAFS